LLSGQMCHFTLKENVKMQNVETESSEIGS